MNIAHRIENWAQKTPDKVCIKFPRKTGSGYHYDELSFKEFNDLSSHYSATLSLEGIQKGDKVLLFVRPSFDFPALTFALFKIGAIPILIDPGMGLRNLFKAIKDAKPDYLIAVNIVHILRMFKKDSFKTIKKFFTTEGKIFPHLTTIKSLKERDQLSFETQKVESSDLAAILFTSGGTGRPKGVEYTHEIFNRQTDVLQELFNLTPEDVDVPGFPLFSFFTMSMGMTSVIPDMNPSKPAKSNPEALVKNINDNGATFIAGSPAIWERVGDYLEKTNQTLKSVKHIVMFGAPVRNEVHEKLIARLEREDADTYTPYGATECLPVSCFNGREVLTNTQFETAQGGGTCIGQPCPGVEIRIIKDVDGVIKDIKDTKQLAKGMVGEIIVRTKTATAAYHELPDKTREAKIYDGDTFWHRMGDLGKMDAQGRVWFFGRKAHQVKAHATTYYPISTEAIFNKHPQVKKSALIWILRNNRVRPALTIEPTGRVMNKSRLKQELKIMANKYSHTKDIDEIFICSKFPVDIRHNIKIDRKALAQMAQQGKLR